MLGVRYDVEITKLTASGQSIYREVYMVDYKNLIDIWIKFKDTLHYSRTILNLKKINCDNFYIIQGQKILFKDISRTSRTSGNPVIACTQFPPFHLLSQSEKSMSMDFSFNGLRTDG